MTKREIVGNLARMADAFERSVTGLGVASAKDILDFERGTYQVLFLKPSKRLSSALSIDREIAVLFTSFTDIQARTIKAVKHIIHSSGGRLEATVAIVVHCDSRGDGKLRNWGRESGIAVLPVLYRDGLPQGEEFERILCHEMFSHDPFDITGPVSGDAQFYGRRTEAQDLARRLQNGHVCSALGIRKIGKTSIINRVVTDLRENYRCLCLMIDCSRDQIWQLSSNELISSIGTALRASISDSSAYRVVDAKTDSSGNATSADIIAAISNCTIPVILFFDEVDYITPGSPTATHWTNQFNQFWRTLRSVYQEAKRAGANLSVFVSGVSSKWFSVESIDGVENAALAFVAEDYLSPLPRGATVAMVKKIGRVAGLQFDDSACERIGECCGDMPFWVRKACSYIHRNTDVAVRPVELSKTSIAHKLDEFVKTEGATLAHVALRHLFRVYPDLQDSMRLCSTNQCTEISRRHVSILQRYGLISQGESPVISGQMLQLGFALYMEDRNSQEKASPEADVKTADSSEVDEWAEELAVIGKRRNILEKRLRALFLNFVRVDHLKSKTTATVSGRIHGNLSADRQKRFLNRSAEEIVDSLFWKELVDLICDKEWALFGQLLGDKARFRQNCEIINDRPDAHAKSVDAADLALHRRSMKSIEDLVNKIL